MAIWTTPPATIPSKELSLGEVNFGVESRMFVFAYQSANTSGVVTDTSIPAYNNLVDFTPEEITQYQKDYNILVLPNTETTLKTTDVIMKYIDKGVTLDSGLRISSNGQVVGTLMVPDQQKNIIFKIQYIDPPEYQKGITYRAYSHVSSNGRLYRLRAGAPTPFTPDADVIESEYWEDIGKYKPQFSVRQTYTVDDTYMSGEFAVHGGSLYQLSNKNSYSFKTATVEPDSVYWMNLGAYSVDRYNPPTTYSNTQAFTANNGVDGVYVQFDDTVYKLRAPLPYKPTSDDEAPNLAEWDILGPVCKTNYTINTVYQLKQTVIANAKVYQLVNTVPFKATSASPDPIFWDNLGKYANTASESRIFRIIINAQRGSMIEFETGQNLHNLRIGEQVGEIFISDIVASSGKITTYSIADAMLPQRGKPLVLNAGFYPYLPKGLSLAADGRLCGRPKGPVGKYYFDVQAQNTVGLTKYQRFYLEVVPGYTTSTFSCSGRLSQIYEREWYKMISSTVFDTVSVYRASDPNYGIRDKPEIRFKDNILGKVDSAVLDFSTTIAYLKTKMFQEPIMCRVGNLRFRTAVDSNGVALYDYLYKELVPLNTYVIYDTKGHITPPKVPLLNLFKEFLVNTLASDDEQLTTPLSFKEINNGQTLYLDACPLWQTNPSPFSGVKPDVLFTLPVAYLAPGDAQRLIDASTEDDLLKTMFFNKTIAVETMAFKHHTDEFDREISVTLKSR